MTDAAKIRETVYRLDGPLRWATGENYDLVRMVDVRPGQHVLDVGAGTGYLTLPLALAVGPEGHVACVDLSSELLGVLRDKAEKQRLSKNIQYCCDAADDLSFADESFDFVFSSYLLHELGDNAQEALREMHRVLKPLGQVVIADFRRLEDEARCKEIEAWYSAQPDGAGPDERHLRFNLADLEKMLADAGFRHIDVRSWREFHMHAVGRKVSDVED